MLSKRRVVLISCLALFLVVSGPALANSGGEFFETTWLFIAVFVAAKGLGILCEKINVPSLVGEICGGIVLGNLALFGIHYDVTGQLLNSLFFKYGAELGVVFLLFMVGLESNLKDLFKVGIDSFVTASIGVILPTLGGIWCVHLLGLGNSMEALFVGATFAATSVGITAKMLSEVGKIKTKSAQIILGAAVIDDVMGLVILAVLAGMASTGSFALGGLVWIVVKVMVFFALAIVFGRYAMPHGFKLYKSIDQPGILTALAIVIALIFSNLASLAGLAPIVGAFTAGLLLDDVTLRHAEGIKTHQFQEIIKPITDFLLPLFFVSIGVQIHLETLFDLHNLFLIAILLVIAIVGKSLCGFLCRGQGIDKIGIGLGMIPRGEVGLIFATFGLQQKIIPPDIYAILVSVVLLTTVAGPILLKLRVKRF